ncbi:MAG: 2OG-Fe(II) oxygenase [Gemmataceae bacterium]|nr:2OG-Fe(II) oxygenase [Gemmataceae bacterium]
MNPKKQKVKDRRRARKLADEAWEAVHIDNLDLAEKIIRRAVVAQTDNPVLWNDLGMILAMRQNEAEAAKSFRTALSLAPTFAEAYAHLAALRFQQGFAKEAVALQTQAVMHAPQNVTYAEKLKAYQSLVCQGDLQDLPPESIEERTLASQDTTIIVPGDRPYGDWPAGLSALDWVKLGDQLTRHGCVLVAGLVDPSTCNQIRRLFDNDAAFAKTVVMDRPDFGQGVYRYFRAPVPDVVQQLRRAVYPHVASIANGWQRLLGESERYPAEWDAFRDDCHRAGQTTPTPILLKYGPGGFNALHRDLRGAVFFPVQMAVVLSPRVDLSNLPTVGFRGGEFLLCDVPEGKKSKRREVAAGLGDAVLFCTRDRLVPVGGVYGLQPVKHGLATITAGERYVLGVPFHEYR